MGARVTKRTFAEERGVALPIALIAPLMCAFAPTGGGQIPERWFVKPGTYRDVSDG